MRVTPFPSLAAVETKIPQVPSIEMRTSDIQFHWIVRRIYLVHLIFEWFRIIFFRYHWQSSIAIDRAFLVFTIFSGCLFCAAENVTFHSDCIGNGL